MNHQRGYTGVIIFFVVLVGLVVTLAVIGVKTSFPSAAKDLVKQVFHQYPTFKKCVNEACTTVEGIGFSSCEQDRECKIR